MQLHHITFTRFIAALTVVFFHYGQQAFPLNIPWLGQALKAGPIAVNYFYLLSGFIMAIAYFTDGGKNLNKKQYWLARFARIYPVYLLALLLVAASQFRQPGFTSELLLNLTLLQAWIPGYPLTLNAPGWSLSVEAFFYLTLPVILLLIERTSLKTATLMAVVLWVFTQVVHTGLLNSGAYAPMNHLHDFIYYHPLMHINAFLAGVVAGAWLKRNHDHLQQGMGKFSVVLMLLSTLILFVLIAQPQPLQGVMAGMDVALTNGILAPLFLLFIVTLALDKGFIARLFGLPLLVLLGEASYSLYILQRPVYGIYDRTLGNLLDLPEPAHFYIYLLLLIIISVLSFKLFESPLRYFIRRKFG